jgi:hypothetical protein
MITLKLPSPYSDELVFVTLGNAERSVTFKADNVDALLVVKVPEMGEAWELGLGRGKDLDELIHCLSLLRSRMAL